MKALFYTLTAFVLCFGLHQLNAQTSNFQPFGQDIVTNGNFNANNGMGNNPYSRVIIGASQANTVGGANINGYRLVVMDGILTEKVRVALSNSQDWADYVFEEGYQLMSLEEKQAFVQKNKHLPNVPSAEELVDGGMDLREMAAIQQRQIEELYLHLMEVNESLKQLKAENEALKAELAEEGK